MLNAIETEASPSSRRATLVALLVAGAFFMENLDGTVIATALPQMARSFGASPVDLNVGNPACFSLPPTGELGNLARNMFTGPSVVSFDFGITKNTKVNERLSVQFRAEFFNLPNKVNFGRPSAGIFAQGATATVGGVAGNTTGLGQGAQTGGQINGAFLTPAATQTTSRQIQFGLKVTF